MNKTLKIDSAGRIVLPHPIRRHFHLEKGSLLEVEIQENAIVLRPETWEKTLVEENGLLVHDGEPSGDLLNAVELTRKARDRDVSGPAG